MSTTTTPTHDQLCRAHAIGCAAENIAESVWSDDKATRTWAHRSDAITEGDGYLADGTATCYCRARPAQADTLARWIASGLQIILADARRAAEQVAVPDPRDVALAVIADAARLAEGKVSPVVEMAAIRAALAAASVATVPAEPEPAAAPVARTEPATVATLDGTDDAADWIAAGHVLDAADVTYVRSLILP